MKGPQSEVDLGRSDLDILDADHEIAGKHQSKSPRERVAVRPSDDRKT